MTLHPQMTELHLNKPEAHPRLDTLLDPDTLVHHIATGLVRQEKHPDGQTMLYAYTHLVPQQARWDGVTGLCRGLVVRDQRVMARPLAKAWMLGTLGMPETRPEGFPPEKPELVMVPDGVQVSLYEGLHGPEFAEKTKFVSQATLWAGGWYRKNHRAAIWPEGHTVVFQVVGPKWQRVVEYQKDGLVLVGMVENATGQEMGWENVCGWAEENEMEVVRGWKGTLEEAVTAMHESRGIVAVWHQKQGMPVKVMIPEVGYSQAYRVVMTCTPTGIWDILARGGELDGMKEMALPRGFREWVERWEGRIRGERIRVETDVAEVWGRAGVKSVPVEDREERKKMAEEFRMWAAGREWMLPVLWGMAMGSPNTEKLVWDAVKKITIGQGAYRGTLL